MTNISLTLIQVDAVKAYLIEQGYADDDQLLADMIEGETNAFEVIRRLLNEVEARDGDIAALSEQVSDRQARKARHEAGKKAARNAIAMVLEAAGLDKVALPEATISLSAAKPKLTIVDPAAVPENYQVVKREPDKRAINDAYANDDNLPNWLTREIGERTLNVRRK